MNKIILQRSVIPQKGKCNSCKSDFACDIPGLVLSIHSLKKCKSQSARKENLLTVFIYKQTNPTPNKKSKLTKSPSTYI